MRFATACTQLQQKLHSHTCILVLLLLHECASILKSRRQSNGNDLPLKHTHTHTHTRTRTRTRLFFIRFFFFLWDPVVVEVFAKDLVNFLHQRTEAEPVLELFHCLFELTQAHQLHTHQVPTYSAICTMQHCSKLRQRISINISTCACERGCMDQ